METPKKITSTSFQALKSKIGPIIPLYVIKKALNKIPDKKPQHKSSDKHNTHENSVKGLQANLSKKVNLPQLFHTFGRVSPDASELIGDGTSLPIKHPNSLHHYTNRLILARVSIQDNALELIELTYVHPQAASPHDAPNSQHPRSEAVPITLNRHLYFMRERSELLRHIRHFFYDRDFLESPTPSFIQSTGTDPALAAISLDYQCDPTGETPSLPGQLRTSPEFEMKRLLCSGASRIFQIGPVWRDHELGERHQPEFTLLEWYRAWDTVESVMIDVEELIRSLFSSAPWLPEKPFLRITMQQVVENTCHFDILTTPTAPELYDAMSQFGNFDLSDFDRSTTSWNELFSLILVDRIDPWLTTPSAFPGVFIVDWPIQAAILAQPSADDPRVAERFEFYLHGYEIANGFGELTDPDEQAHRFTEEIEERRATGLPVPPYPTLFIETLREGMPPSGGVAVGVDRLLMLLTGRESIDEILPFALTHNDTPNEARWRFR